MGEGREWAGILGSFWYGLMKSAVNIVYPSNFTLKRNPQWDGIWRWGPLQGG